MMFFITKRLKERGDYMFYCPYCGTQLQVEESYCLTCGKEMTKQIKKRIKQDRTFNRYWLIPIISFIFSIIIILSYYLIENNRVDQAKQLYDLGEEHLMEQAFDEAIYVFEEAIKYQPSFSQAKTTLDFTKKALNIKVEIDGIQTLLNNGHYDKALALVDEHEKQLRHYQGEIVNKIVKSLTNKRDTISIAQIQNKLSQEHSIEDLKVILWEATAINNDDAQTIADNIRQEIADYSFSIASEKLNKHHFNDALFIVEDGLKYAPYSDKLLSLQQTIEKEKVAFETAQQERIEQALHIAEEEQDFNENKAVEIKEAHLSKDEQDRLVVSGEIKSQATVPIQSVFVEYKIVTEDGLVLETNRVFTYPERLYPKDVGSFEFTHYDIDGNRDDLSINIEKITWYID